MNTKKLRVEYNNKWPDKFLFPVEEALSNLLKEHGIQQILAPAKLSESDDKDFHSLLGHCIESFDHLPYRPDHAFDAIWKALDSEFFRVQEESGKRGSRFDNFLSILVSNDKTCKEFSPLLSCVPMQTCEFFAKRILDSHTKPDNHSDAFLKRVKDNLGENLFIDYLTKYENGWRNDSSSVQRKAGGFLRKLLKSEELEVEGRKYKLTPDKAISLLVAAVMSQFRNERFHGNTFPPFRSSSATLKTYAHAYYLLLVAYSLTLEVYLYRDFGVISLDSVKACIRINVDVFGRVFSKAIDK